MSPRLRIAGLVSLTLHVAIAAGILFFARRPVPLAEAPDKPVAVELVLEEHKGAGKTTVHPLSPQQPPQPEQAPPPQPPEETAPSPDHATTQPAQPTPPAKPAPPRHVPEINIGGTDSESNAIASGDNIIPATPDKKSRNRPPVYPEEAARRGQQGAVLVVVHVGPSGLPSGVDLERSSGYVLLDQAAENAVMKWTFVPAVKDGLPVPFDFRMNFTFAFE
jgi:protein TonB